jgi:hypothetical protein
LGSVAFTAVQDGRMFDASPLTVVLAGIAVLAASVRVRHPLPRIVRGTGVVTARYDTGVKRGDCREVRLDLMVTRPRGGQFAARETTWIPASALDSVAPGCVVDTYYRHDDESVVTVRVPPV